MEGGGSVRARVSAAGSSGPCARVHPDDTKKRPGGVLVRMHKCHPCGDRDRVCKEKNERI